MVSANFDNSPKVVQPERIGSFVRIVVLLAWIAIGTAIGSIWWNDRSVMTGSQWAARAANGAAICLAVIYTTAFILILWLMAQWFIYRRWVIGLVVFCIGITPAVVVLWGFLEGKLSPKSRLHIGAASVITRLIDLDELAHIRLLGGSLWQRSQVGSAVQVINPSPVDAENRVLSDLDEFIKQIRQVIGSESKDLIYIHFEPPFPIAVTDTANWIAFDKPIRKADSITENVWLNCARATLRGDIAGNANPPSILTAGYIEYFSRNTDDIMDDYFDALHKSEFISKLSDLTTDLNYSQNTHEHHLVGGAFVTYLIEELRSQDLLALCQVANRNEFDEAVQSKLGKSWSEVCGGFEQWLVVEADRLGWRHGQSSSGDGDKPDVRDRTAMLSRVDVPDVILENVWNRLLGEAMPMYESRMNANDRFGIEIKTKFDDSMKDSTIEFDRRLRVLKDGDNRWYSAVDEKGELSLALTAEEAVRAERMASTLLRQTHAIPSQTERARANDKVDQALRDWLLHGDLIACLDHYLNDSDSWTLTALEDGGPESPWAVEFVSNDEAAMRLKLTIDPNAGFRVKNVSYVNGRETENIESDFVPYHNDFVVATEGNQIAEKKTSMASVQSFSEYHMLSQNEEGSFREELAYMKKINMQPQPEGTPVPVQLLRVICFAFFSFTALGAVGLVIKKV